MVIYDFGVMKSNYLYHHNSIAKIAADVYKNRDCYFLGRESKSESTQS